MFRPLIIFIFFVFVTLLSQRATQAQSSEFKDIIDPRSALASVSFPFSQNWTVQHARENGLLMRGPKGEKIYDVSEMNFIPVPDRYLDSVVFGAFRYAVEDARIKQETVDFHLRKTQEEDLKIYLYEACRRPPLSPVESKPGEYWNRIRSCHELLAWTNSELNKPLEPEQSNVTENRADLYFDLQLDDDATLESWGQLKKHR